MPASDYTSTGGGLKLKGAKSAGIDKKRKKVKKDKSTSVAKPSDTSDVESKANAPAEEGAQYDREKSRTAGVSREGSKTLEPEHGRMKTEAERKHEEVRRKRVSVWHTGPTT